VLAAFPPARVPFAVATWGASGAFAAGVGPTVGALLVDSFGWRSVFLANVPVGAMALILALRVLPESRETVRTRFPDPWGTLLLALSLTLLALGIVQSEAWGILTLRTVGVVVSGLVALALFLRRSRAVPHPALDLGLFARPSFRWANLTTAVFTIGFTALFFALIQFMTSVWHYDVVRTGLAMMPAPFVVMVLGPQMGRAAARYGQRRLLVPGGLVYAAAGAFLLVSLDTEPAWATHLLPASLLTGLGASLVLPQLTSAAVRELTSDEFGAGAAVNQAVRQFGATFGIALTVALLAGATPLDSVGHFQRVWAMVLGCGALASLTALALPTNAPGPLATPVPAGAGTSA